MYKPNGEWLNVSQAMTMLMVSRETVKRLCRDGRIGVRHVPGGLMRLCRADVERIAEESRRPALQRGA